MCNSEEEVPYFRLYHNFLPFPDHYSEQDRRLLAYQSTLLTQALNSHHHDGNSPTNYSHYAYVASRQAHHGGDGKSRLRQQLMQKRKLSGAISQTGETPSKMQLVRRSSDDVIGHNIASQYQHRPLHHSNSYPIDPAGHFHGYPHFHHYHHHMPGAVAGGAAESFMAQLHPHHPHDHHHQSYLLDGGYTTLAPVAPDALHGFMTSHQHHMTSQMHSNQNNNHPYPTAGVYRPPLNVSTETSEYYHPLEGRSPRQLSLVQSNTGGTSPPSPKRRCSGVQSTSPSTTGFRFAGNSPKPAVSYQQRRSSEKQGSYQLQYSIATPQVGPLGAYHTAAAAAYYAQAAANVAAGSQSGAEDSYHLANQGSTDWFRKLNNNMGMMVCIVYLL